MQRDEENGNLGCSIESVQVQIQNGTSTQILQENTTIVQILRQACTKRIYIHITGEISNAGRKRSIYDKKFAIRAPPKIIANQLSKGRATIRLQHPNTLLTVSRASIDAPVIILAKCPVQKLKNFMQVLTAKYTSNSGKNQLDTPQHLKSHQLQLDSISPLNKRDITAVSNKLNTGANKATTQTQSKLIVTVSDHDSTTPSRKSSQKTSQTQISDRCSIISSLSTSIDKHQQEIIDACTKYNLNVFFTGAAGTGKSYLLKTIIHNLPPHPATVVTGSTGVAACQLINGTTLHSWLGIGVPSKTVTAENLLPKILKKKNLVNRLKSARTLIIDEISMIDGNYFSLMDDLLRLVRSKNSDKIECPFGGLQVIVCGDFLQLPPVNAEVMAFETEAWKSFKVYNLEKIYRQADDAKFAKMLQLIRVGKCNETILKTLRSAKIDEGLIESAGIEPTILTTHVKDVDSINTSRFALLECEGNPAKDFNALDTLNSSCSKDVKKFDKLLPSVRSTLRLCKGAQVMLNKNINVKRRLVNGARGVVIGFGNNGYPRVRWLNCKKDDLSGKNADWPVVGPVKFTVRDGDGQVYQRSQLPLNLAWAVSIHKSQGMTLDFAELSLSKTFEDGQAYVALSRITSLKGLKIKGVIRSDIIKANKKAVKYYLDNGLLNNILKKK